MGTELVHLLELEFNKLYEDNDVIKIETKIRNIRFLGELTKFNVCPTQIILECLNKCLDDFHPHNIEIIINLLETCGKYLFKMEESTLKFTTLLERLHRYKESKICKYNFIEENISTKSSTNLEVAIQQCKGSAAKIPVKKQEQLSLIQ